MSGLHQSPNLYGRSFLTLMDFTAEEIMYLLELSARLKEKKRRQRQLHAFDDAKLLYGRNIVLLFEKTSTRTRCSFEVAAFDEGAHVTFLGMEHSQINKKESLEDSAKVLGRMYDAIEYRGYGQEIVEGLAKHSGVPVYNGLTDADHPTQILADLLTIQEHIKKPLNEVHVVFVGDIRNNMSIAWAIGCAKLGMSFTGLGPKELMPDAGSMQGIYDIVKHTSARISFTSDVNAIKDADVVYTDVWASMGEEHLLEERVRLLTPYRVDMNLFTSIGSKDAIFMHCLPAYHDFETQTAKKAMDKGIDIREVSDEVFRHDRSVVFDEAENRMHTIKAVLVATLAKDI